MIVTYEDVRKRFLKDHPLDQRSNRPALWNLDQANNHFLVNGYTDR